MGENNTPTALKGCGVKTDITALHMYKLTYKNYVLFQVGPSHNFHYPQPWPVAPVDEKVPKVTKQQETRIKY